MSVIRNSRVSLSRRLEDATSTVLVLSGADGDEDPEAEVAEAIHDLLQARKDMEPWREWFLVKNLAILTSAEREEWFGGSNNGRFAVLGGGVPKLTGPQGVVAKLLRKDGKPSILRIRRVFAKGDQL